MSLTKEQRDNINNLSSEERFKYCIKEIAQHKKVWILTDDHGCVMLNTDEEEGIPVWPHEEFAQEWATGEWSHCKAESISINKWFSRWTMGLENDQLSVVVFPDVREEGVLLFPEEFEYELKKRK